MESQQPLTSELNIPNIVILYLESENTSPSKLLSILKQLEGENYDQDNAIWKVNTKYYEAVVRIQEISLDLANKDYALQKLDYIEKKEAFIYYFQDEKELNLEYYNIIADIQENHTPEIGLLFYNGPTKVFKKMTETLIDKIIQNHFIEYLREDLEQYHDKDVKPRSGLLGEDEKIGIERLIESLQCCMWSNMKKKKIQENHVSLNLIKDLERQEKEKQEFLKRQEEEDQRKLIQQDQPLTSEAANDEEQKENQDSNPNQDIIVPTYKLLQDEESEQQIKQLNKQLEGELQDEEEEEAESMLLLMQEIKELRERNKVLTDEERRKNAEQMILKLSQYMNLEEEDFDDDEDFDQVTN